MSIGVLAENNIHPIAVPFGAVNWPERPSSGPMAGLVWNETSDGWREKVQNSIGRTAFSEPHAGVDVLVDAGLSDLEGLVARLW